MDVNLDQACVADLDGVLTTDRLERRPFRTPDHEAENRTLQALAQELASRPADVLQKLAETVLDVCGADEDADVAEIARAVTDILQPQADAGRLAARLRGAETPLPLWTDSGKVRQILINLVGNAIKYTAHGEIEVRLDRSDPAWLSVHARDTGPGIEKSDQERIFEAFIQVDSSYTRGGKGTDLGLSIARKMARLLGGDVTLESTPGEGSTFTLRLPRAAPEAP